MKKNKDLTTFKDMLARLEEIAESLDDDAVDLEKAIALYEEGVQLSENCINSLKNAELKISALKDKLTELQKP